MSRPSQLRLLPNVAAGVKRMIALGYVPVVVTNQGGVARGLITPAQLEAMHRRLRALLRAKGVRLAAIEACPHRDEDGCSCRKPKPGMLKRAARALKLDLKRSVMIGDTHRDVEAGQAVGAATILLAEGDPPDCEPDFVARDLVAAAQWMAARIP